MSGHARLPFVLLLLAAAVCIATVAAPPGGRAAWALEVGPGIVGISILVATYRRFPMSHWVYVGCFIHLMILIYGGYYTYALTPVGNWARDAFGLSRNHYDRVGHVALGVFPVFVTRELLLRLSPLRPGKWLTFLLLSVVLAVAAVWELLEWWTALIVASDVGIAFLGSQGDVWDAQWDMFLALVGAAVVLPLFSRRHDRSIARIASAAR